MLKRPQFSMADAVLALTFSAVWCSLYASRWRLWAWSGNDAFMELLFGVMIVLPAGVAGALLGRPWVGLTCGLASAIAHYAIIETSR